MTNRKYRIAVIPGDGIGQEVIPEGQRAAEAVSGRHGFEIEWQQFDWSCQRYAETGRMMPEDGIDQVKEFDAIYLGAVGFPGVADHVSLWGLLIPHAPPLDLYANVRPVRLLKGVTSPLAGRGPEDIDFIDGARERRGRILGDRRPALRRHRAGDGLAGVLLHPPRRRPRPEVRLRVGRKAQAPAPVTSATKSNGIIHTMPYWDERFAAMAKNYPDVKTAQYHIDILTAHFVPPSRLVRRGGGLQPLRRHPLRPRPGGDRFDRHRAGRQSQPASASPRCSSRCTARHPTSPARASPTRWPPFGRPR
jgi:tartrate dehydrogenase/decarboxylase / D-malate dehydrogenase